MRRIVDERALEILALDCEARTVGKKGIALDGGTYQAPELGAFVGRVVRAARHPDRGRIVVWTADEPRQFICLAIDIDLLGESRRAALLDQAIECHHHMFTAQPLADVDG
jgi:hypothetical protein